jgi:hypothetical protein
MKQNLPTKTDVHGEATFLGEMSTRMHLQLMESLQGQAVLFKVTQIIISKVPFVHRRVFDKSSRMQRSDWQYFPNTSIIV